MRAFIISQLTQFSTWLGLVIILCSIFLPHNLIFVVGLLIIITPDDKFQKFFTAARTSLENWWRP